MSQFTLSISTDNAAFHSEDCKGESDPLYRHLGHCSCPELIGEIIHILNQTAKRIDSDGLTGFFETIRDSNGNDVGRFSHKADPQDA